VTPPGTIGAGIDLLRRLGLKSSEDRDLADVHQEFFPPPEDRSSIRPEPGCSDSTFVGSATDVSVLAAQLLDSALAHTDREKVQVSVSGTAELIAVPKTICIARLGRDGKRKPARAVLTLPHDWVLQDTGGHYEVRLDEHAVDRMGGIVGRALSGDQSGTGHTGGLLLGQFDDACGVVWVSEVTGPPRGSTVSPHELQLNVAEAGEHVRERGRATGGLLAHVGYWHTHPGASATPSELDRQQMEDPPSPAGSYPPRVLFLIVGLQGGGSLAEDRSSGWVRDVYAHVIFPD
jgi:proteasome lid subunit RPN8/RPN11